MPEVELWERFFDPVSILHTLELDHNTKNYVDVGCGFGTFLIPAAKIISGVAIGIDINQEYLDICRKRVEQEKLPNIELIKEDLSDGKTSHTITQMDIDVDYISLFNMLHCENPVDLLKWTERLLAAKGKVGVIHWKPQETPRGPAMAIRPSPSKIRTWGEQAGLKCVKQVDVSSYHYGVLFEK
nr:class I SAM-dependent methyltransferase [Thalassobacillus sp. CUG 92003]